MKRIVIALITFLLLTSLASAATLKVGPHEKYKTIQSAVNAAKDGDTIKVAYGTYKENIKMDKYLTFIGTKYPKVYGFYCYGGGGIINGFSIQKNGIDADYSGNVYVRNDYFYNCGIGLAGGVASNSVIMNNQITGGTISVYDTDNITITGNTISKSKVGLYEAEDTADPTVTKNTFKNCKYAVYFFEWEPPYVVGHLPTFSGNKYIGNKINFGCGPGFSN